MLVQEYLIKWINSNSDYNTVNDKIDIKPIMK